MKALLAHLADLHLGRKSLGDPTGSERWLALRAALTRLTRESLDALLIAGDTFDGPHVDRTLVQTTAKALDQLRTVRATPLPVVVIPGNHDPSEAASLWTAFRDSLGPHSAVRLVLTPQVITLDGGRLEIEAYPCETRFSGEPPWNRRLDRSPDGANVLRVVLAHGTLQGGPVPEGEGDAYPFTQADVEALAADYVALGHFHGVYPPWNGEAELERRLCYAGTHEPDQFAGDSGWAVLAELAKGQLPRLRRERVGRRLWRCWTLRGPGDLKPLEEFVAALSAEAEPKRHVVRLELSVAARFSSADLDRIENVRSSFRNFGISFDCRGDARGAVDVGSLDLAGLPSGAVKQTLLALHEEWTQGADEERRAVLGAALQLAWDKLQPAR